jgi:anti-anti-sigma factor
MGAMHQKGMARRGERVERSSGAAPPLQSTAASPLGVDVEHPSDGVALLAVRGELDLGTIPRFEGRLFEELHAHPVVVVDLSGLSFIDSSGIGLLIKAHQSKNGAAGFHTVISRGSQIERVFTIAGIDRALSVFVDRGEAIAAASGGETEPG